VSVQGYSAEASVNAHSQDLEKSKADFLKSCLYAGWATVRYQENFMKVKKHVQKKSDINIH